MSVGVIRLEGFPWPSYWVPALPFLPGWTRVCSLPLWGGECLDALTPPGFAFALLAWEGLVRWTGRDSLGGKTVRGMRPHSPHTLAVL